MDVVINEWIPLLAKTCLLLFLHTFLFCDIVYTDRGRYPHTELRILFLVSPHRPSASQCVSLHFKLLSFYVDI